MKYAPVGGVRGWDGCMCVLLFFFSISTISMCFFFIIIFFLEKLHLGKWALEFKFLRKCKELKGGSEMGKGGGG